MVKYTKTIKKFTVHLTISLYIYCFKITKKHTDRSIHFHVIANSNKLENNLSVERLGDDEINYIYRIEYFVTIKTYVISFFL